MALHPEGNGAGNTLLILNGWPGAGKLTLLKALAPRLEPPPVLFDNHLLIDPVQAIYPGRGAEHQALRSSIRGPVFAALNRVLCSSPPGTCVLLTVCLAAELELDAVAAREDLAIGRGTDARVLWVNATCAWDELAQRAGSAERVAGSKTKLTDEAVLRSIVDTYTLFTPALSAGPNLEVHELETSGDLKQSVRGLLEILNVEGSDS